MKYFLRALSIIVGGLILFVSAAMYKKVHPTPVPVRTSWAGVKSGNEGDVDELMDILHSRNDNDPRLDRDFNELSSDTKRLFRKKYLEIPAEKRNERGTIVYLLGKNLLDAEDWEFFRQVALEPPCLSLSDCTKKPLPGSDEEATGDEVTLAYPPLVALRQAGRAVEAARACRTSAQGAPELAAEKDALDLFAAVKKSKTRAVARMAALNEKKFALP
jgi:hypothetical protein